MIPPGYYNSLISGFFGNLDTTEQNALFQLFVDKNPNANLNDITTQENFLSYVRSEYEALNATDILSPDEVVKRHLVFSVFDILLELMKQVQNNVGVLANYLDYNLKYQDQYAAMMAKTPLYKYDTTLNDTHVTLASDGTLQSTDNLSFGYDNISVTDIINSVVYNTINKAQTNSTADTGFSIVANPNATNEFGEFQSTGQLENIKFVFEPTGTPLGSQYNVYFQYVKLLPADPNNPGLQTTTVTIPPTVTPITVPPGTSPADTTKLLQQAFLNIINTPNFGSIISQSVLDASTYDNSLNSDDAIINVSSNLAPAIGETFRIFWPYNWVYFQTGSSEEEDLDNAQWGPEAMQSRRDNVNAKLQQFLQSTQAYKQVLQNRADAIRSTMDASQQAVGSTIDILNSIVSQLSNIISAIYKR